VVKILITGAGGLIGTNLLRSVDGAKVYSVVYTNPIQVEGSEVIQGDLTDPKFVDSLPQVDYVIHAAGYAQPSKFTQEPVQTIKLNTQTLISLFDKCKTLLYLSSSEVYSGCHPPYKETDIGTTTPSHPRSCYIEAKRCGEAICQALGGKVARVSLVYGPGARSDDTRVLYEFIRQGFNGKIVLKDQGQAYRTYCYVDDCVEMLWDILFDGHGVYNVGGTSEVTICQLAHKIGSILGVPVELGHDGIKGAPESVRLDLSRVAKEFGKTEFVGIDEGLERTIRGIRWQETNGK